MKSDAIQDKLRRQGSPLAKYRRAVVGEEGVALFLYAELVATLLAPLPGQAGIVLRRVFLPRLFAQCGPGATVGANVVVRRPRQIRLGRGVFLGEGVTLDVKGEGGRIEIRDDVHIGRHTILSCPGGDLVIGAGTRIGAGCRLGSLKGLEVGKGCVLGDHACLVGAGHAYSALALPIIDQPATCRGKTVLQDGVRLGKRATVLDGVEVGEKAEIAPGSLVNRNIPAGCRAGGVPAEIEG